MSRVQLLAGIERVFKLGGAAWTGNRNVLKGSANVKDAFDRKACNFASRDVNGKASADYLSNHMAGKAGVTALHYAAWDGLIDVCKYALDVLKYDVNVEDFWGKTPLACAVEHGHTATAKFLVEHGAAINIECGLNALHYAAKNGNIEVMKFLLDKGASADMCSGYDTPLVWAAGYDQQEAVKLLLEHGANPNGNTGPHSVTAIEAAIANGSVACLELLIEAGANVDIACGGEESLHIAAYHGRPEIIKCLLKAGANPDRLSDLKFPYDPLQVEVGPRKPIEVAAASGQKEAVEILFPVTTPVDDIREWSVDGIFRHVQSIFGTRD